MICDPWHLLLSREREIEDFRVYKAIYRVVSTGETFHLDDDNQPVHLNGLEKPVPANVLVVEGLLERLDPPTSLPAGPETYTKGDRIGGVHTGKTKALTFYNGITGAGLVIGTGADGAYQIRAETYKGEIRRVYFDFF